MSSNLETFKKFRNETEAETTRRRKRKELQSERKESGRKLTYWNFLVYSIFPIAWLLGYAHVCRENRMSIQEFRMEWAFVCFLTSCIIDISACAIGILSLWNGLNYSVWKFARFLLLFATVLNLLVAFALPSESKEGIPSRFLGQQNYPAYCYTQSPLPIVSPSLKCQVLQRLAGYIWFTLVLVVLRAICIVNGNYAVSIARYGAFYPINKNHDRTIVILPNVAAFPYKIVVSHPGYRPGQTNVRLTQSQLLQLDLGHDGVGSKTDAANANYAPAEQREKTAKQLPTIEGVTEAKSGSIDECSDSDNDTVTNVASSHQLQFNKKRQNLRPRKGKK